MSRLAAGIHGIGLNTEARHIFGKCILVGEQLMPDKNADAYEICKCKYAKYDVYIGITEHYLILSECEVKKVWMGAVNCSITMKNGSFLKLQLPKSGGLGGGMPHHAEYRERSLECLGGSNT